MVAIMSTAKRANVTYPPSWTMGSLACGSQIQLGIPDTILFHDGAPQAWLFTSKAGVVLKKRTLRKSSIKERFIRLSVSNPNNPQQRVAIVRFGDGTVRYLGREVFQEMIAKLPTTEPGVVCVQCYVQGRGSAGTVHRNSYRIINDKGLVVTETNTFTTLTGQETKSSMSSWNEREIKLEKSNASNINRALDAVTLTLVHFLEHGQEQPTRILHLQCDYVVDVAGQIWLTWTGPVTAAIAAAAQDLRLANVRNEGPRGRAEFLGMKTSLAMQRDFGGPPAPVNTSRFPAYVNTTYSGQFGGTENTARLEEITTRVDKAAEAVELPAEAVGGGSGGIADTLSRAKSSDRGDIAKLSEAVPHSTCSSRAEQQIPGTVLSTMTVGVRPSEAAAWESKGRAPGDKHYPSSFACTGDFCTIRVLDPREDADDPRKRRRAEESTPDLSTSDADFFAEVATRLFSGQELSALRRDASFRRQIEEGLVIEVENPSTLGEEGLTAFHRGRARLKGNPVAGGLNDRDPKKWYEISWKSVSIARTERSQDLDKDTRVPTKRPVTAGSTDMIDTQGQGELTSRSPQELTSTSCHADVRGENGSLGKKGHVGSGCRALQQTEASEMRQHARKREEAILAGGAQNFYKTVRVCETCFRVYTLLDRARVVLARRAALARAEAAAYERSDYVEPLRCPASRSGVGQRVATVFRRHHRRRRLPDHDARISTGPEGPDGALYGYTEDDPLSLSWDEAHGRSSSGFTLPTRPQSHDDGPTKGRKRALPTGASRTGKPHMTSQRGRTWRGRLAGADERGLEKGPELSSGKKFQDLDDYLRGSAAAAAQQVKKKRSRLAREERECGSSMLTTGHVDGVTSTEAGEHEGTALFHARVFLAESDSASAKAATEILERAGYLVTVEGDGKQVLESMIDGDGDWDALLIERDLPVMDGFGVTAGFRDFEKARRNRASSQRTAAVEKHGRRPTRSYRHGMERDLDAPSSVPPATEVRYLPIICLTSKASPDDLRSYMASGMDGCVSKPLESGPLLNTLRAAIPHHLSRASSNGHPLALSESNRESTGMRSAVKLIQSKGLGVLKGSAAVAAKSMALAGRKGDNSVEGALQVDADTSIPYCIVGSPPPVGVSKHFFNLVICHDLFDNLERMKIIISPVIARYPGAQVLLWNYPGQAFSEWREQQLLNNEYLATTLQYLLFHLGSKSSGGTGEFDTERPFHLVGFGAGGAVATFHASHFSIPCPRSLILLNSFSYVDAYLAGVLHDCMNVFTCAPESRPDLPVYFHARFLFSPAYLGQVSTPLALNIYTAVHNPISVRGRIQLCRGTLSNVDTRPVLSEIDVPVICIQSTQNNFVKPLHTDAYVSRRGGEAKSIHKVLHDPEKTCVVWMNAGHEILQEARAQTTTFLEQAIAGYHEGNDVVHVMANPEFASACRDTIESAAASRRRQAHVSTIGGKSLDSGGETSASGKERGGGIGDGRTFEDGYIDRVLTTVETIRSDTQNQAGKREQKRYDGTDRAKSANARGERDVRQEHCPDLTAMGSSWDGSRGEIYGSSWEEYRIGVTAAGANAAARRGNFGLSECASSASEDEGKFGRNVGKNCLRKSRRRNFGGSRGKGNRREGERVNGRNIMVGTVLDAGHPAFERQDNLVYGFGHGSKVYPQPEEFPEVKEYMAWRLKRNRKRLVRLDRAARKIQGVLRGFLALKRMQAMREERACLYIQRMFRGWQGRLLFLEKLRSVWASQIVQRNWRGFAARKWFALLRRHQAACGHIQRVWRGAIARRRVRKIRGARDNAAALLQALWRGVAGRRRAFRCREEKLAAVTIQRVFRGHTGRRRAGRERDKYLFSKSQSQGIEFGRQMLLEHKLHATRLQSDIQLLTGEKVGAEEAVEAVMEEISEFEEAVTVLEKEMHQLSKIETEAVGVLDEEARLELREQKVRLDKEFGEMLGKIADRKDRLVHLEKKLASIDRARLGKEEELRTLERKLVVLLEEQQRELEGIRRRQEKKGILLLKTSGANTEGSPGNLAIGSVGGGVGGPSAKDKRQAAQLMQSTETLMKFGFMSMSMTYFSSLNMIRAMRSVGATDTIIAALDHNAKFAEARNQADCGSGAEGNSRALALEQNEKFGNEPFRPTLKPGQLPGQEPLKVAAWSVEDVARWLQTLTMTQYQEAFIAAAVDGAFLYDLNDDDLKSSLGVEHRLHRKKILNSIERLKAAETERARPVTLSAASSSHHAGASSPETFRGHSLPQSLLGDATEALGRVLTADSADSAGGKPAVPISFKELVVLTRRGKYKQIREILEPLPERRFDPTIVRVPYVQDHGTAYVEAYEKEPFNLNKVDDFGNSLLIIAAQNGHLKIAKLFVNKGANANHQNKQGQTAGHYAISYQFFDFSEWLYLQDGTGVGADDTIENKFGLGPYDGLQ